MNIYNKEYDRSYKLQKTYRNRLSCLLILNFKFSFLSFQSALFTASFTFSSELLYKELEVDSSEIVSEEYEELDSDVSSSVTNLLK